MRKLHILFIAILCIEVCLIGVFTSKIIARFEKPDIKGAFSINILSKDRLNQSTSKLKYFYEPQANSNLKEEIPWNKGQSIVHHINSDTLHNEEVDANDQTTKIVALGDSFTFGQYVNTNENWVSLLDSMLHKKHDAHILNLGVEGYDIEYAVERFRIRGIKYSPHLVIWFLKGDDFISIAEEMTQLIDVEKMKFIQKEMKDTSELVIPKHGTSETVFVERAKDQFIAKFGGIEKIYEYQKKKLRLIRDYYKGKILVIYLPLESDHSKILEEWRKNDPNVFLLRLPNYTDDLMLPDQHPNNKGHMTIANTVYTYLEKNKRIFFSTP